jgi:hypothetical protein
MTRSTSVARFADYAELIQELDKVGLGLDFTPIDQELFDQCLKKLPSADFANDSTPISNSRFIGASNAMATAWEVGLSTRVQLTKDGGKSFGAVGRRKFVLSLLLAVVALAAGVVAISFPRSTILAELRPSEVDGKGEVVCPGASFKGLLVLQGDWTKAREGINANTRDVIKGKQGWLRADMTRWWSKKQSKIPVPLRQWYRWTLITGLTGDAVLDVHFDYAPSESMEHRVLRIKNNHARKSVLISIGGYDQSMWIASKRLSRGVDLYEEWEVPTPDTSNVGIDKSTVEMVNVGIEFRDGTWFVLVGDEPVRSFVTEHDQPNLAIDLFSTHDGWCKIQMLKFEHLKDRGDAD